MKYFIKELEEKRGDREVRRLFEILENITDIRETEADRLCRAADHNLCALAGNLEVAVSMCNKILAAEDKMDGAEDLSARRQRRRREWDSFAQDVQVKTARVDGAFRDKERELVEHYRNLREKLHVGDAV